MKTKPEKQLKIALTSVLIALLVVVTGLAFVYKKHQVDLLQKDLKINVLMDEIGEIKSQNQKMNEYFAAEKGNLKEAVSQMVDVQKKVTEIGLDSEKQKELQKNLAIANGNLLQLVQKKEETIHALKTQNRQESGTAIGKEDGFVNILILGENAGLTDTIMVASINTKTRKVTLLSVPRDLFYNGRKINEYYEKFGMEEMQKAIKAVTGIAIEKYVVVDMSSFVDIIDQVGGIDLDVPKNITDASYPGPNHTYTTVSFKKGYQHMNGTTALKYARSRKSTTDFDRSERQQQIILALRQKAEEMNLKDDLGKLSEMYTAIKDKVATNIGPLETLNYYNDYRTFEIKSGNTISNQNYLYSTTNSAGQYILLPQKNSYVALQGYIKKLVNQ